MNPRTLIIIFVATMIGSACIGVARAEPAKKPVPAKVSKVTLAAARAFKGTLPPKPEVVIPDPVAVNNK